MFLTFSTGGSALLRVDYCTESPNGKNSESNLAHWAKFEAYFLSTNQTYFEQANSFCFNQSCSVPPVR